ncbi:hypothetical protein FKM52_21250 [Mixta tenebrionis]|uniref:DUF6881 domain-containing protein n=1 Tax=Mixta tenebrionis TaxID=2562439 RepID=A0A506UWE1_9GAMM|nr:hypothetical protein [Mixta tenebrionis]TPW37695.1 hypothetical protein FKM52_21250 [Mixta tenebrionis]
MKYIKVHWEHSFDDEPTELYSEIDDSRYEVRKVEVFSTGDLTFSDQSTPKNISTLGELPIPSLNEINQDPQFKAIYIDADEFENVWIKAIKK